MKSTRSCFRRTIREDEGRGDRNSPNFWQSTSSESDSFSAMGARIEDVAFRSRKAARNRAVSFSPEKGEISANSIIYTEEKEEDTP